MVDAFLPTVILLLLVFSLGRLPRWTTFAIASSFELGQTLPFLTVGSLLFEGESASPIVWLAHGLFFSLPVLVLHGKLPGLRAATLAIIYVVPPFGLWMPNSPALAIGILFPNTGLFAIPLFAMAACSIAWAAQADTWRNWRSWKLIAVLTMAWTAVMCQSISHPAPLPRQFHGQQTQVGAVHTTLERSTTVANLELPNRMARQIAIQLPKTPEVWFLAEGMVNDPSPATHVIWATKLAKTGVLVVAGTYSPVPGPNKHLLSGLSVLGDLHSHPDTRILDGFSASQPFPLVMWAPWRNSGHFPAHSANAPVTISGARVHISFCFESNLIWPHWRAAIAPTPKAMISLENRWATRGTSFENGQNAGARLVARWLNVPLISAINR